MFRTVTGAARTAGRLTISRGMSSSAAVPKSWTYGAVVAASVAGYLVYKDGGISSPKLATSVVATPAPVSASSSFENLTVDVSKDGTFTISHDVNGGKARSTQVYEKSGKPIGEPVIAEVVAPAPPAPVIAPETALLIADLEASIADASAKISNLSGLLSAAEATAAAAQTATAAVEAALAKATAKPSVADHKLKISYFAIRGLADPARVLLHDNGVEFVDNQLIGDAWNELKPSLPYKQVPLLEDNGVQIVQSGTIMRHLGDLLGLSGETAAEKARVDFIYEGVADTRKSYYDVIYRAWDTKDDYLAKLPATLANLNALYEGQEFAVGNKPTYADYALYSFLDCLVILSPTALDGSANLKALHARIAARPGVAAYSATSRPTKLNGNDNQ